MALEAPDEFEKVAMMNLARKPRLSTTRFLKLLLMLFTMITSQLSYAGVWGEGKWGTMKWGDDAASEQCNAYGTSGDYVQMIFLAYLGRPPAPEGLKFWAERLDAEEAQGKLELFDNLFKSAEAQAIYENATVGDRVEQFFQFMYGRAPQTAGKNAWVDAINDGVVTLPESAAVIADSSDDAGLAVLNAKRVAATKLTCAIGDDAAKLSAYQQNIAVARASIAVITTADQAVAFDGEAELAQIIGSRVGFAPRALSISRDMNASERDGGADAAPIPTLSMWVLFLLSGLVGLFGVARLRRDA